MGKQHVISNYCSLLIIIITSLGLVSCESPTTQDGENDLNKSAIMEESFDLSYDPFLNISNAKAQSQVFSNFLITEKYGYSLPGSVRASQLEELFLEIKRGYSLEKGTVDSLIERQYHAFPHAMDVFVTSHLLLSSGGSVFLTEAEEAALLIAALGHDALHSGVFNSFLIKSNHPYALEDGNKSIQEKRSLKYLLKTLDSQKILIPEDGLDDREKNAILNCRELIKTAILWTDMTRHKEQVKAVNEIVPILVKELNKARRDILQSESELGATHLDITNGLDISSQLPVEIRHLVAGFILHCADVSNLGKPWSISEKWAFLVCSEFFTQGDLEKQLKMDVSMNCDRVTTSIPNTQINFGKYVIAELYELLAKIINDRGNEIITNYKENQKRWNSLLADEKESSSRYQYIQP